MPWKNRTAATTPQSIPTRQQPRVSHTSRPSHAVYRFSHGIAVVLGKIRLNYPHKVIFSPVTSVPYWDGCCGSRFSGFADFEARWPLFWDDAQRGQFVSRDYVVENLTLEKCARDYVQITRTVEGAS
jgi:hypothetical protein